MADIIVHASLSQERHIVLESVLRASALIDVSGFSEAEADDLHHALHVGKPTLPERLASAVWSPVDDLEEADLGELIWNGENVSLIAHRIGEKA